MSKLGKITAGYRAKVGSEANDPLTARPSCDRSKGLGGRADGRSPDFSTEDVIDCTDGAGEAARGGQGPELRAQLASSALTRATAGRGERCGGGSFTSSNPSPPPFPQVPKADIIFHKTLATSSASRTSFSVAKGLPWRFVLCVPCVWRWRFLGLVLVRVRLFLGPSRSFLGQSLRARREEHDARMFG